MHAAIMIAYLNSLMRRSWRILRQSAISATLIGHSLLHPQLGQVYVSVVSIKFISLGWMNFWNDPHTALRQSLF
jgi:hypothetical protein